MTDGHDDHDEDALFRRSVGKVRPVDHDRHQPQRQRPRPLPRQRERDEGRVLADSLSGELDPAELDTGEHVHYLQPGLQHSVLRKLQRGQYRIEASLDLHGMDRHAARSALVEFLGEVRTEGKRCVRIVHGKGLRSSNRGPVLKPLIAHWLKQRREVLGYCSAPAADGGSGALYVLLRSR